MASGYSLAVVLHVVVAVLGAGQIGGLAVVLAAARRAGTPLAATAAAVESLLRYVRVSLGLLVLTGVWLDVAASGALHQLWWVRVSFLLVVVEFFLLRRAVVMLLRGRRGDGDEGAARRGLERLAWSMCGVMGLITVLMRVKPF